MALPFLQLSQKFLTTQSVIIAARLRVHRHAVIGMAVDLFAFTVEQTSSDARPPDGVFLDPDAVVIIEAAMGWTGEPGRAFEAFRQTGLIEKLEIGARVKGCDRYKRTWEKNQRRAKTGTKPAEVVPVTGTVNAGKVPLEEEGDGDGDGLLSSKEEEEAPPPPKSEAPREVQSFLAWATRKRSAELGDTVPRGAKPSQLCLEELGKALGKHGRKRCELAFQAFLADRYWITQDPPCPMNGFTDGTQLPGYLSRAYREAA